MSQPEQLILTCPACGGRLRAPRSAIGTSVGCPSCQAAVQVREAAAFAPSAMIVDASRRLGVAPRGESSPVADPVSVAAVVRPEWLAAIAAEPGVITAARAEALATYS